MQSIDDSTEKASRFRARPAAALLVAHCCAFLCLAAGLPTFCQAATFPVVVKLQSGAITWTNVDEITIGRVALSTVAAVPNTATIWVVRGGTTNQVLQQFQSAHRITIWNATNSPHRLLNPGDRVVVTASTATGAYATIEATVGQSIGSGGGGSGDGFPLTKNADAGGYNITGIGMAKGVLAEFDTMRVGSLIADVIGTNLAYRWFDISEVRTMYASNLVVQAVGSGPRLPFAYVMADNGTNHTYSYGPRMLLTSTEINDGRINGTITNVWPGQLVRALQGSAAGGVYIATNRLDFADFPATTNINWMPGMAGDQFWRLFSAPGANGVGTAGPAGIDGVGGWLNGLWSNARGYVHDTNAWITVDWNGRIYRTVASSTGIAPDSVSGSNYWAVAVDKGASGTITVYSNFIVRGAWDAWASYTNLDLVTYDGNEFVVWETNAVPPIGTAPGVNSDYVGTNTPYWTLWRARGERGAGGTYTATSTVYQTFIANEYNLFDDEFTVFENAPASTNANIEWVSLDGGTNRLKWTGTVRLGTNILSAIGTNLYLNGTLFKPGGDGGGISGGTSTSDWLTVTVQGGTNLIIAGTYVPAAESVVTDATSRLSAVEAAYRPNNTTETAYAQSVVFPDGSVMTSAEVGSIAPSNLPDTVVFRDQSNAWSAAQSLPAGSTIGSRTFNLFVESTGTTTEAGSYYAPTAGGWGLWFGTSSNIGLTPPDGGLGGGVAIGTNSISLVWGRVSASQQASGPNAFAVGFRATGSGSYSSAPGGYNPVASGNGSIAAGGYNTGPVASKDGAIALGQGALASGLHALSAGGFGNQATNSYSVSIGGYGGYAYGYLSYILQSFGNVVRGNSSGIIGGYYNEIPASATNAAIIAGVRRTNATPNSVMMPAILMPVLTSFPVSVQSDAILEAWVNWGTGYVKYAAGPGFTNAIATSY